MNLRSTQQDLLVSDVGIGYFESQILVIDFYFGMGNKKWAKLCGSPSQPYRMLPRNANA